MKRPKKKSEHFYISPPSGVTILASLSTVEKINQPLVKQNLVRSNAVKLEKLSAPVSAETRKSNFELFAKLGIPSIASLKVKEEQLKNDEMLEKHFEPRKTNFDAEAFSHCWEKLCARIRELGKDSLLATLSRYQPEVDYSTFIIAITIDNRVQEQDLNREKPWILDVLRAELENDLINFDLKLTSSTTKMAPYTNKEKFAKMAEKNPALIYLADKFKLDF